MKTIRELRKYFIQRTRTEYYVKGVEEQSCPHACWKPQFSKDVSFNCFRESSGIFPAGLLQLLTQLSGRGEEVSNDATILYWGLR